MFDHFCDYMYYLLTSPFKKVKKILNQWYILFRVLGRRFDDAMESLYKAREQTMLATCDSILLPVFAEERKIARYPGETDENFRTRIANYPEVLRLGGTDPGVLLAVRSLGYENVMIVPAKKYTGDIQRWAEFYIIITLDLNDINPVELNVLKKQVRKTKEVGARDNYSFTYQTRSIKRERQIRMTEHYVMHAPFFDCIRLDGSWKLDGSILLNAVERVTLAKCEGEIL